MATVAASSAAAATVSATPAPTDTVEAYLSYFDEDTALSQRRIGAPVVVKAIIVTAMEGERKLHSIRLECTEDTRIIERRACNFAWYIRGKITRCGDAAEQSGLLGAQIVCRQFRDYGVTENTIEFMTADNSVVRKSGGSGFLARFPLMARLARTL